MQHKCAIVIAGASYGLTRLFHSVFRQVPVPWIKVCVDMALFSASYGVQRLLIFGPAKPRR